VSVTVNPPPGWAVAGGLLIALCVRSGPDRRIVVADARQLLRSLASATSSLASAHATSQYVPTGAVAGIVTVTDPEDSSNRPSSGRYRLFPTWSPQELKDVLLRLSVVASLSAKEITVPFAREQLRGSVDDPTD
jgi:hypothetical protein